MITLISTLLFALIFSFFALQNTQLVTLQFQNYSLGEIPLYVVAIVSMLIGIGLSLIISAVGSVSTGFEMFSKGRKIESTEGEVKKAQEKLHDLEVENALLKGSNGRTLYGQPTVDRPNLLQRVRHQTSS